MEGEDGLLGETELWERGFSIQLDRDSEQFIETPYPLRSCSQELREELRAIGVAFSIGGRNMSPLGRGGDKIGDGAFIGLTLQHGGNFARWWYQGQGVIKGAGGRTKNIEEYYNDVNKRWGAYTQSMYGLHGDFANAQIGAAENYANRTTGGVNKAAALERQANLVTYEGAVGAAKEVRDASSRLPLLALLYRQRSNYLSMDRQRGAGTLPSGQEKSNKRLSNPCVIERRPEISIVTEKTNVGSLTSSSAHVM